MKVPNEELGVQAIESVEVPAELKEFFNIADNMEGVIPRLPQIKIIHRGQMFEMPDGSKIENFEGIILDQHAAHAWWEKDISESGGNALPDCFSLDGITPVPADQCANRQNDKCETCPQNQFGSDLKTGKGKACKNMKRLHILMEGSLLPKRLTIPPTSIRSFETYMTTLVDMGLPYACVVSIFSLSKKVSGTFEFAEVKILKDRILNKDELKSVVTFIKKYKDTARKQEIHSDEYMDTNGESQSEPDDIPF